MELLPLDIHLRILRFLDLSSLYSAVSAFPPLAQTFTDSTARIIEACIAQYPYDIQRCIRAILILSTLRERAISLQHFVSRFLYGDTSGMRLVGTTLIPAKGHQLLWKAWRIHWMTQYYLTTMMSGIELRCHGWIRAPGEPASWIEEQRLSRAFWRLQVCFEIARTPMVFAPGEVMTWPDTTLWSRLPRYQCNELETVTAHVQELMHRARARKLDQREFAYLNSSTTWSGWLEEVLFRREMVQPTWPIRRPPEEPNAVFRDQSPLHLDFGSIGYSSWRASRSLKFNSSHRPRRRDKGTEERMEQALAKLGAFIWDSQRIESLGLADPSLTINSNDVFPGSSEPIDPVESFARWNYVAGYALPF